MIEFFDIEKSFKSQKVLQGVSGLFEQRKVSLIIGASGCGKSVLLKCLTGLQQVQNGRVLYDNREFLGAQDEVQSKIRREIGMLFQGGALFDSMNTEENVMFPLNMFTNLSQSEKRDRVNFCLERVGMVGTNAKMPSELSGGMKKRVGIARAIVNSPKYLFCDEPNSGLDPRTSIMIDQLIQDLTYEFSTTTVVVTHDINAILSIGDYIIFLENGHKSWEGTSENIATTASESLRTFLFSGKFSKKVCLA